MPLTKNTGMKQILIPTDFSDNAWNALKYGLELFKKSKCTFYLLHVDPLPPYSGTGTAFHAASKNLENNILEDARAKLRELIDRIEKLPLNAKHTFVTIAISDFFVDTIKREAEEKKIDFIIMGTKGATGLKKVTMGSNTGDVITKVKCPLLAVPENAVYSKPKEIAFPMDFYLGYDVKVLDVLIELALLNKAALRILHVSKKGEELSEEQSKNKDFLEDYLMNVEHSFHFVSGTKLEVAVQCFVESRNIDMIAMVAKNLNYFQRILFRPSVEQISYHTEIPFLVLHER